MNCNACERDDKKQPGDFWCETCFEYLCTDCKLYHGKLKFTSHHFVLPIADKQNVSELVLKIPVTCQLHHNQPFTSFCQEHDEVVCESCCQLGHGECPNLQKIMDVVNKDDPLKQFQDKLKEVKSTLEESLQERQKEKFCMDTEERKIQNEILEFRKEINDRLDSLQSQILESLKTKHEERLTSVTDARGKLDNLLSNLNKFENDIKTVTKHVKSEQLFTILWTLGNSIKGLVGDIGNISLENEITVIKWKKSDYLGKITELGRITCSSTSSSHDIASLEEIGNAEDDLLGQDQDTLENDSNLSNEHALPESRPVSIDHTQRDVHVEVHSSHNRIPCPIKRDADLNVNAEALTTNDSNATPKRMKAVHLKKCIDIASMLGHNTAVECCCFYGDNIVFADSSKVYLCNQSEQVLATFSCNVTDIHCTQNDRLLLSIKNDGIYELRPLLSGDDRLRLFLKADKCSPISSYQDEIVTFIGRKSVGIIDINGKIQKKIAVSTPPSHLCCDKTERFFYTSHKEDAVTSYDIDGTTKYRYQHRDLKGAQGVATDNEGNVYVCGYESSNILKIATKGKGYSVILSTEDGIKEPLCIDVNKNTRQMMVLHNNQATIGIYTM